MGTPARFVAAHDLTKLMKPVPSETTCLMETPKQRPPWLGKPVSCKAIKEVDSLVKLGINGWSFLKSLGWWPESSWKSPVDSESIRETESPSV